MAKDKYITKDGYHIEDIVARRRCVWCGRMAQDHCHLVSKAVGNKYDYPTCSRECKGALQKALDL